MRSKPFGFHIQGTHQARPAARAQRGILDSQKCQSTDRGPHSYDGANWTRLRRDIAFQVMQHHDGGHKPRWLPAGATPPIVSSFALVPRRWW